MSLSGYPVRTPVVDLVEIGAGGGSIAWVDSGGLLRVGPQSAGADPGPVCYRRGGTEPTVTDANVVLGRLNPSYFLGGEIGLDVEGARRAIEERCAKPLGLDVVEAANGIVEIANAAMVNALHLISVQRGYDPRDFVLVGFGGAGPVHANALARDAEMPTLLIPPQPRHLLRHRPAGHRPEARHGRDDDAPPRRPRTPPRSRRRFAELEAAGRSALEREGLAAEAIELRPQARPPLRRPELRADDPGRRRAARALPRRARPHLRVQRARGAGRGRQPAPDERRRDREAAGPPARARRPGRAEGARGPSTSPRRAATSTARSTTATPCPAGATFAGPAIVEEFDSTTVVHPGFAVRVDDARQPGHREGDSVSYGIVVVEGRDGADAGRHPPRHRRLPPRARRRARAGPLPDDRLHDAVRQDRAPLHRDRRLLRPARLRRRAPGPARPPPLRGHATTYFHSATPHTGEDGYDTIEWIAAQPWCNGRTGTVGSSYAGITQIRTALESPPHLTAIWPDVAPTNTFQNQTREGGAMQLHMFWALYIHAADAQGVKEDWEKQREVFGDLQRLRELLWNSPVLRGRPRAPPRAGARPDARGLLHARRLRRVLGREGERLHALLARARRHPGDDDDRLVRPLPARRQRVLRGDDGEERVAAAADHRAVEPRRHARRRDVDARRRLRADVRLGRAALLRRAARRSSTAGCRTTRPGSRRTRRPCRSS